MKSQLNILLGGLGLFALQGCKTPQAEQAQQPNVIYVFPDQFRNQAMEFWGQEGFREKVNFRNDPVHTPRLNDFARDFGTDLCHEQLPVEQSSPGFVTDRHVSQQEWHSFELQFEPSYQFVA